MSTPHSPVQPHEHTAENCIFCKIIEGKIPSRKVFEDDDVFAFHDINPWAPVHFLLIPKLHIPSMAHLAPEYEALIGKMMVLAPKLALQEGCKPYPDGGYRIVTNTGAEGGQEVHHLHFHVMGGPRPWLRG
jgi:histidine triad (HIT) family protein